MVFDNKRWGLGELSSPQWETTRWLSIGGLCIGGHSPCHRHTTQVLNVRGGGGELRSLSEGGYCMALIFVLLIFFFNEALCLGTNGGAHRSSRCPSFYKGKIARSLLREANPTQLHQSGRQPAATAFSQKWRELRLFTGHLLCARLRAKHCFIPATLQQSCKDGARHCPVQIREPKPK